MAKVTEEPKVKVIISRIELAALRGCSPPTISRKKLPQVSGKRYDITDPEVWAFITEPDKERWERDRQREDIAVPQGNGGLDDEKIKADIVLKQKRARNLDVAYSREVKDLIPVETMLLWMGEFRSGLETNILTLGNKIGRGDIPLRNRVEKHVKAAIEKTLEGAAKALKREGPAIFEALNGHEEDE